MKQLHLEVRNRHYEAAVRETSRWCAVDLAMFEQIQGVTRPQTTVDGLRFTIGQTRYLYPPTSEVLKYIPLWDEGQTPPEFDIDIPEPRKVVTNQPRGAASARVGELRATKPARSPRDRRSGRKVNMTIDDDLQEYDRLRKKHGRKDAA